MEEVPVHSPYKVLIVDDSAIVRGLVTRMMAEDDEINVVGSVNNGEEALAVMEGGGIEVVVLDIEMPVMDGLTALPKLLEIDPTVRVIMASTLTKRNADISFQAMTLGAVDYIPKPSSAKDLNVGEGFRAELLDKVKAWAEQRRKMLEVEEAHALARAEEDAALEAAAEHPVEADPQAPQDPEAGEDAAAAGTPTSDDKHDKDQAPFRAEMSVEHQQMQKVGRIQRKRFTAELRPRPMQQHPRPQQVQMRPTPQTPVQPAPSSQSPQSARAVDPGQRTATVPGNPRVQGAPRDPGGLIRDAAIAVGNTASKAAVAKQTMPGKPSVPATAKPSAAPAARAPSGPAPKQQRPNTARGSSAPAPTRARVGGGKAV
ncbi:response regulator, partial [Thalassospira lucentensis]